MYIIHYYIKVVNPVIIKKKKVGKKKKGVIAPIEADPVERLTRIYAMENWMRGGGGGRRGSTLCFI